MESSCLLTPDNKQSKTSNKVTSEEVVVMMGKTEPNNETQEQAAAAPLSLEKSIFRANLLHPTDYSKDLGRVTLQLVRQEPQVRL